MARAGNEASRGGCVPGWWPTARRSGFRRAGRGVSSRQALWWGCRSLDSPGRGSHDGPIGRTIGPVARTRPGRGGGLKLLSAESDGAEGQELPELLVSPHRNLVTPSGLSQIEATGSDCRRRFPRRARRRIARAWRASSATCVTGAPGSARPRSSHRRCRLARCGLDHPSRCRSGMARAAASRSSVRTKRTRPAARSPTFRRSRAC